MAKEFGIDLPSIEFVHLMPDQQLAAMESGEIDAMACWEPWTTKAQSVGGRFWFSGARSEISENEGDINWLVDQSVLMTFEENFEKYPETLKALLRAFQTATRFINKNIEQAAEILSKPLSIEKKQLLKIVSLNKYSMKMDNLFKIGLLSFRELLHQNGAIATTPPESDLYSTEFLRQVDPVLVLIEEEEDEDEDEELEEYLTIFFDEVDQIVRKLEEDTLVLEKNTGDKGKLKAIAGAFHTLKGNSGFLGFEKITTSSRQIEGYLKSLLLDEEAEISRNIVSLVFYAIDILKILVADYREKRTSTFDISALQQKIAELSPEMEDSEETSETAPGVIEISGYEGLKLREAQKMGKSVYQVDITFEDDWKMKSAGAFIVVRKLGTQGEVVKVVPPVGSKELKGASEFKMLYVTDKAESQIIDACSVPVVVKTTKTTPFVVPEILVVQKEETDYLGDEYAPSEQFSLTSKSKSRTLRVDYQKLDDIVNIIGELIIGGSTMARSLTEMRDYVPSEQQSVRLMDHLEKTSSTIRKNLLNLQENVMKVRMTPIDVVFRKFPRVVRDLALKSGKEVTLHMRGEGTDLDKNLVDVIDEPLYHLIKNTIDHGIEAPMVREQLGKPHKGSIYLNSYREGNQIVIVIADDGRGVDIEKMKRQAFETGLMPPDKLQKFSKIDTFNLLFLNSVGPTGPSTVTNERSGIMVVQHTVESLNGTIELDSRLGEGTTFTIKLPLTLAIIQALVFGVGPRNFAIPLSNIDQVTRISPDEISLVGGREVFELRERVVNLIRPHKLLNIPEPERPKNKMYVIVVSSSERRLVGVIADKLMEKEELVIKSLDSKIMRSEITSSASKLGDGKVVLILDVPALIRRALG
jgi:two-component system chemotaxis sensor kinase CheA